MEQDNVLLYLAWIPEHLIDPMDLNKFMSLDNVLASDQGKVCVYPFLIY